MLRTKIRMRAATCREVLYDPLPIPDPQVEELCCRLSSSARNNVVGISGHAVGYMNQIGVPACDTEYLNKREGGGRDLGGATCECPWRDQILETAFLL